MGSMQTYGLKNNLIRWVHRHDRMATLFRSTLPGSQRSVSPGTLPAYRSTVQPESQGRLFEGATFESQSASPMIDKPVRATPGQMDYSAEPTASTNTVLSNKSASLKSPASQEEPQPQDRDWQRLQAIFRKHEERTDTKSPSIPETAPAITEPSAEPNLRDSFPEDPQPEPAERQNLQPVFRKPQIQAERRFGNAPKAAGSKKDADPPVLPASSEAHEPVEPDAPEQTLPTIQRQHQEHAETRSVTIPEPTTAATQATASVVSQTSQAKEQPNLQQRVWHGLKSIFRKPQEPNENKSVRIDEATKLVVESTEPDLRQPPSNSNASAKAAETTESTQHALPFENLPIGNPPVQRSATAVLSTKPVPRSNEDIEAGPPFHDPAMKSSLPGFSKSVHSAPKVEVEPRQSLPDANLPEDTLERSDQEPAEDHIQRQPLPLEAVWNVQRLEATEFDTDEPIAPQDSRALSDGKPGFSKKTDQKSEQATTIEPTVFPERQAPTTELGRLNTIGLPVSQSSRRPVETLPPSRPRPIRASVMPSKPIVQRQPETRTTTSEVEESALVDTAIGPLPADLWSLLGEKSPASSYQSEIRGESPASFHQQRTLPDPATSTPQESSVHAAHLPAAVQRQTLPNELSTPASQGTNQDLQKEEPSQAEPDLDDLVRKVYAEVRRRLATEWERSRLK